MQHHVVLRKSTEFSEGNVGSVFRTSLQACYARYFLYSDFLLDSEMSVNFQRATRRYIPDDRTLQLLGVFYTDGRKQPLQKERFIGHNRI
jgi:hypothetical protein